ncbi:YdcF family protein [Olsenella profusa]|uniref:YdcF family protein n=1 Tax=Olsenella profusa TaxID=138595 RepID=A0ABS2F217_9ACTN|nr:YdcF family protein [Olsenella profusa]MBM6774612.1 YdcF family protein [Olsenella profusa]
MSDNRLDESTLAAARTLFDYERVDDPLERRDVAIGFGNHSEYVARRAAELYLEGLVDKVLFTGGLGRITRKIWNVPEAERFARVAERMGVREKDILLDTTSTNTGENISHSRRLLAEAGMGDARAIVVEIPFRGRRTRSALEAQWPELDFIMASPTLDFEEFLDVYTNEGPISVKEFVSVLVGDVQRIVEYGRRGWQTPQDVPADVTAAYELLVARGFTSQLLRD